MDFVVAVAWAKEFQQSRWAVGYCERCRCAEAVRIGREVTNVSLYHLIRIGRSVADDRAYCDWCGEPLLPWPDSQTVPVTAWSYSDGLNALVATCAPDLVRKTPVLSTADQCRAFLRFVRKRSSIEAVDVSFGLTSGLWIGTLVSVALGYFVGWPDAPDRFQDFFRWWLVGLLVGAVVGSAVDGIRLTRRVARDLVAQAYRKYQMDPEQLLAVSASFPRRVRAAVQAAVARS